MKLTAILVLCLSLVLAAFAQDRNRIAGTVLNNNTGQPVPNASVFINGTSKGTVSRGNGGFELTGINKGSFELVVSSVGFQTLVLQLSSDTLPITIELRLQPRMQELETVTVMPWERSSWRKYGRTFIEGFIGTSAAAQDCEIRNRKVLRFRYASKARVLEVMADEPLIIENKALGYRITYQLEGFTRNWKSRTVVFTGYSFFEELPGNQQKQQEWKEKRKQLYKGSLMHFIRSLYNDRLWQDSFEVRRLRKVPNVEKLRIQKLYEMEKQNKIVQGGRISFPTQGKVQKDSLNYFQQILKQDDSLALISRYMLSADSLITTGIDSTKTIFFQDYLQVVYKKAHEEKEYLYDYRIFRPATFQKSLIRLTPALPIVIQRNGLFFPPQNVFTIDYWGWSEKVSHMLPWDYQPDSY
ncbi:carboxypeptidase-like regulatory domain-containing protein [Pseudoflavitalea rhizosphaerae]|uniref:carboxypeptidase-like regulatory domain-containing protein n=1 Tax=Pseudoflavitalea rhizosphaerae TaxID=1884793 RepID=UPI000F8E3513|nr:carboxypeptidase-like regulatory domain-containing protein [Pseudoflavitalea rhizosphaerae]